MTPNDEQAPLFLAPSNPAAEAEGQGQTADEGTEAMRRLRHPFAVEPARATKPTTERSHTT
jgi:hypothetical protein